MLDRVGWELTVGTTSLNQSNPPPPAHPVPPAPTVALPSQTAHSQNGASSAMGQTRTRLFVPLRNKDHEREVGYNQPTLTSGHNNNSSRAGGAHSEELAMLLQKKRELEEKRAELDGLIQYEVDKNRNMSDVGRCVIIGAEKEGREEQYSERKSGGGGDEELKAEERA